MYRYADFDMFVPEMEARHVYIPDLNIVNKKVSTLIKDLGEKPKCGIPTRGEKKEYHFVKLHNAAATLVTRQRQGPCLHRLQRHLSRWQAWQRQ